MLIRKIDELGRVIIPIEYRQSLGINDSERLEIILKSDRIEIKKPTISCIFCNAGVDLVKIGNKAICRSCSQLAYNAKEEDILYPLKIE